AFCKPDVLNAQDPRPNEGLGTGRTKLRAAEQEARLALACTDTLWTPGTAFAWMKLKWCALSVLRTSCSSSGSRQVTAPVVRSAVQLRPENLASNFWYLSQ